MDSCSDTFSLCEPVSASLENALDQRPMHSFESRRSSKTKAGVAAGFNSLIFLFVALMREFERRFLLGFLLGDRTLDRGLHLLEGADLDLTHALA